MIYTVTFNPAVDYVMHTDTVKQGTTNRSFSEEIYFGGKGINVSLALNELGVKTKALGFVAGFTGAAIKAYLENVGIETDFVHLDKGFSRINVKIKSEEETEINGSGPCIDNDKIEEFLLKTDEIKDGDTLVLAGSVPASLPDNIYENIIKRLSHKNIRVVVDATGELLKNVLKYRPFLIKPNREELGEFFGKELVSKEEIIEYARKLREMGAENVLVSMAGDGAVLIDENGETRYSPALRGKVINSVGAGDTMVAGFLAGIDKGYDYALKLAIASGSATAFSKGIASLEAIKKLMK